MKKALFQLDPVLQEVEPNTNLSLYKEFWGSLIEREELEFTESIPQI